MDFHPALGQKKITITFKCVSFTKLLIESDFITLHVPFPKGSAPVIGKKELDLIKNGAGIVNTARGGVISEADLIEALNSGKISFAGIDVFEGEPIINQTLCTHPKVTLSPHIGGSTKEAQERIGIELAEKVVEYFTKKIISELKYSKKYGNIKTIQRNKTQKRISKANCLSPLRCT
jgi:D-3-phosphoglycerate dehydrogenase